MMDALFSGIDFLFSAKGRIRRLHFWIYHVVMTVVAWFVLISLTMAYFAPMVERIEAGESAERVVQTMDFSDANLFAFLIALLWAGFTWSTYAVTARRWHDRDKSGWWSLIAFVPFIGPMWIFIECGFLPGTRGANRFGDAPGSSQGDLVEVFE